MRQIWLTHHEEEELEVDPEHVKLALRVFRLSGVHLISPDQKLAFLEQKGVNSLEVAIAFSFDCMEPN